MKSALVFLAFALPLAAGEVRTYTGTVVVREAPAADIPAIIVIDEEVDGAPDGVADVVYLFYVETGWNGSTMAVRRAHVEDRDGKQLVVIDERWKTVFSLNNVPVTGTSERDSVFANGIGLARYSGEPVTRIRIDPRTMELTHVCDDGVRAAWCPE